MARIFFALSCIAFLLLVANLVIGFTAGDYGGAWRQYATVATRYHKAEKEGGVEGEDIERMRTEMQQRQAEFMPVRANMKWHFWLGIISTLVTILLNSVSVTYFIGTNRWCQEVVDTYSLDTELAVRSREIKRTAFPWALGGIVVMIIVASTGGLADPAGYYGAHAQMWVSPHWMLALMATLFVGWSLLAQVGKIGANYDVIETILLQVEAIRQKRREAREAADKEDTEG